ncbi:S9 family peptidase [Rhodococcus fascians]|nr:S9 family peptidase [Rhodococcus fascians]MBY4238006.1 S9 family peptidase [Rhodococcus fascians]MBY4253243.1 S9 family peptidase [Rhodococcus fascians]MBY4268880.1 S9 family peptidase [Rhodococcus fascians]
MEWREDPYRWLEDTNGVDALAWASTVSTASWDVLLASGDIEELQRELVRLNGLSSPVPEFLFYGSRLLRLHRSAAHPHGMLSVANRADDGSLSTWRDVVDVDALREAEGVPLELRFQQYAGNVAPPHADRILLAVSADGGDKVELREFDLGSGNFVADGYRTPAGRNGAVWLEDDLLLIAHTTGVEPDLLPSGWARRVQLWRRGTPLDTAPTVFRADESDALVLLGVGTSKTQDRVGIIGRWHDYSTGDTRIVRADGEVVRVQLPAERVLASTSTGGCHTVTIAGDDGTCAGVSYRRHAVLAVDVHSPAAPQVVFQPKDGEFIAETLTGVALGDRCIRVLIGFGESRRMDTFRFTGGAWQRTASDELDPNMTVNFAAADAAGDAVLLDRSGPLHPTELHLIDTSGGRLLHRQPTVVEADSFHHERRQAISCDGAEVSYTVIGPAVVDAPVPTLVTGYGGWGVSMRPGYFDDRVGGNSVALWLRRGGAVAIAEIRGGGERGPSWRMAGKREGRQRGYDDFAAVLRDLAVSGYSDPDHIGVFGSSNGGLLASVVATQHPELLRAVAADAPLTDMLRFDQMGVGAAWIDEYGDPADPVTARMLATYSPYHAVTPGRYPSFLLTVASSDDRVGPGHARKLAARLRDVDADVLFLESRAGGHSVSDALSNPRFLAARLLFFASRLAGPFDVVSSGSAAGSSER